MAKKGKKYSNAATKVESGKKYALLEGIELAKRLKFVNFNESLDIAVNLGIDPKRSDQNVRGSVVMPKGTGKTVKVLVFAKGDKVKEALDAGADYAGLDEYVEKIQKEGWLDFDKVVATPDSMGSVGKLGKILGPRSLMPNPKIGTVTFDVASAVKDVKGGKADFRSDKGAIIHLSLGKLDFKADDLFENARAFFEMLMKLKPDTSKGQYLGSINLSSTMGPGITIDNSQVAAMLR